jgi:isocitrate/isopropylmalate dehydrogenase
VSSGNRKERDRLYWKASGLLGAVYGSVPDLAGKGLANSIAVILTNKMMLDYLNGKEAANLLYQTVKKNLPGEKS